MPKSLTGGFPKQKPTKLGKYIGKVPAAHALKGGLSGGGKGTLAGGKEHTKPKG